MKKKQMRATNTCYNKYYIGKVHSSGQRSKAFGCKYIAGKGNLCHCGL